MFAKAYDMLMADVDYEQLIAFFEPYIQRQDLILDAGCGSGYFLLEILKRGYDGFGVDHDTEMLALAKERLRAHGFPQPLYHHDLRDRLPVKVDVIFMMFDVINYFKGPITVLKNLFASLKPGGRLIFDFYKESVLHDFDGYEEIETDPFPYVWKTESKGYRFTHHLTIDGDAHSVRQTIHQKEAMMVAIRGLTTQYKIIDGPDPRKHYLIAFK